ncbi:MAG: kelch repeat-containing protein [Myxococcota bacterium]
MSLPRSRVPLAAKALFSSSLIVACSVPGTTPSDAGTATDPCAGETQAGRCDGDTIVRCSNNQVQRENCRETGRLCEVSAGSAVCAPDPTYVPCVSADYPTRCYDEEHVLCDGTGTIRTNCTLSGQVCGLPATGAGDPVCQAPFDTLPTGAPINGTNRMPARSNSHSVYDSVNNRILFLFGDEGQRISATERLQDISLTAWALDLDDGSWTELPEGPLGRTRAAAVWDEANHRAILVGGRGHPSGGSNCQDGLGRRAKMLNDVWAFNVDDDTWEELSDGTGTAPDEREDFGLWLDAENERLVLFGGNATCSFGNDVRNDMWQFDLLTNTWSALTPNGTPPRARQAFGFDVMGRKAYLFGGAFGFFDPTLNDTWEFDLDTDTWTQVAVTGTRPQRRFRGNLVADIARNQLMIFGGHDFGASGDQPDAPEFEDDRNDVWILPLDNPQWVWAVAGDERLKEPDFRSPERREQHSMTRISDDLVVMAYGVGDCGLLNDVWYFNLAGEYWFTPLDPTTGLTCERKQDADTCTSDCGGN